jgi:hypothetical protein
MDLKKGECRKFHNKLLKVDYKTLITKVKKIECMTWAGHMARTLEVINGYKHFRKTWRVALDDV